MNDRPWEVDKRMNCAEKATLVILAAGLGSRFGGNKQISEVGPHGETLMEYSIYDAIAEGFDRIVFILKPEMVETVRNGIGKRIEASVEVRYAVQDFSVGFPSGYSVPAERIKPFGTVHAVLCAADAVDSPFATINADDYYGREAFRILRRRLPSLSDETCAVMVPYVLENTMSENGGVTRGVCDIENGILRGVDETHDIHFTEERTIVGERGILDPKAAVSMNIWGFHPAIFASMRRYFAQFLSEMKEGDVKSECLLPVMVNDLLQSQRLTVTAEASPDRWFGITYREDRETVAARLAELHREGNYPERLF